MMKREIKIEYIPYNCVNEALSCRNSRDDRSQYDGLYDEMLTSKTIRDEILSYVKKEGNNDGLE